MALARTSVATDFDFHEINGIPVSHTTGAFTPPSNSLLVVVVAVQCDGDAGANLTSGMSLSGGGWTYTKRFSGYGTIGAQPFTGACEVWTAPVGSAASMTLTVSHSGTTGTLGYDGQIIVDAYTGYDVGSPIGVTGFDNTANTVGALNVTLNLSGSCANTSIVQGGRDAIPTGSGVAAAPGSNWTEINDHVNGVGCIQMQTRGAGASFNTVVWADTGNGETWWTYLLYGMEIKEPATEARNSYERTSFPPPRDIKDYYPVMKMSDTEFSMSIRGFVPPQLLGQMVM